MSTVGSAHLRKPGSIVLPRMRLTVPWSLPLGIIKSVLMGTLGLTLLATPTSVLFMPGLGMSHEDHCVGVAAGTLYCLVPEISLGLAQYASAAVLLTGALGFLPALFALPAAYIALSFSVGSTLPDGGDQVTAILLLLLLPNSLLDWRVSSWRDAPVVGEWRAAFATVSVWMARAQVCIIYMFACLGKLQTPEWVDGSAIYFWVRHVSFGAPHWLSWVLTLTKLPAITIGVTWGTLLLEFLLAISPLLPTKIRRHSLLWAALAFHAGIALILGIFSFAVAMMAAAYLLLADDAARRISQGGAEGAQLIASNPDLKH